ncbi:CDP-diacylglycerol--glycerol-3-phosphate 3-phosphatidyltransferase 2 [Canna indica]|uniref:CDP-diacylglycerol--glycerol-3-phosphate 3-phosphatidyltransferase 2 n=1 Tax=Canna indica TaxID=4628 RepID=A0AAQ3QDP2_9LILI|nr:CDP-diacylglycerol--glycerol-3-phosphate 3-phosphatidyltransferase 2 [Canna indica]
MPPSFPSPTSLKAAVSFPSCHHHRPPPSPFYHGRKRQQHHDKSPPEFVRAATSTVSLIRYFAPRRLFVALTSDMAYCGSMRPVGAGSWWMRPGSGRAPLGRGSFGARNWAFSATDRGGSEKDREQVVGPPDAGGIDTDGNHPPGQKQEQKDSDPPMLLTLPTVLTLGRVAAVPLLICTYYMNGWWATTATTSIFISAAITDWLDGYIARKKHLGTAFGAFLDPVADKLMVAATLVLLCTKPLEVATFGEVPWLLTIPSIAIIGREITMSAVREWAASKDSKVLEAVAVNKLGKWKTATQMIALTILLATRDSSLTGIDMIVASGVALLYISAGLAVWSLAVYMKNIWRFMLM